MCRPGGFVASAKGLSSERHTNGAGVVSGRTRRGVLNTLPAQPRALPICRRVMALRPLPAESNHQPARDQYVVLIVKNRTFDEVYGYRGADGSVRGAPELARFGNRAWLEQTPGSLRVRQSGKKFYRVAPNHHALADRFAISDNFYADAEVSVDGHHWIVGNYPNAWVETTRLASYGGQKDFRPCRAQWATRVVSSATGSNRKWRHLAFWSATVCSVVRRGFELTWIKRTQTLGSAYLTSVRMLDPFRHHQGIPVGADIRTDKPLVHCGDGGVPSRARIPLPLSTARTTSALAQDSYRSEPLPVQCDYALNHIFILSGRYWEEYDDSHYGRRQGGVDHVDHTGRFSCG